MLDLIFALRQEMASFEDMGSIMKKRLFMTF
jgi:hypothetical protein